MQRYQGEMMICRLMKAVIVADDAGKKIDERMDEDQTIITDHDTGNHGLFWPIQLRPALTVAEQRALSALGQATDIS